MFTLEHSLSDLVRAGTISYDEAFSHSHYPKELDRRNPGARHLDRRLIGVPVGAATSS